MTQPPSERSPVRVVMTVFNTFEHDTRVYKEARSLISWGCEVHVVCIHKGELPRKQVQDGINIHRVPINPFAPLALFGFLLAWPSSKMLRRMIERRRQAQPAPPKPGRGRLRRLRRAIRAPFAAVYRPLHRFVGSQGRAAKLAIRGEELNAPHRRVLRGLKRLLWYGLLRPIIRSHRWLRLRRRGFRRWRYRNKLTLRHLRIFLRRVIVRIFHPATVVNLIALDLAKEAVRLRPDVMLSHDLNTLLAGVVVKRLTGVPLVYDSHELYLERNIGNRNRRIDRFLWGIVERRCMPHVDLGFSVAQGICDWLADRYKHNNIQLIRNVQPYEAPSPPDRTWQRELGLPEGSRVAIYAGAITINRGLEQLIDAARHFDKVVVVVMGYSLRPEYLEGLKQQARDNGVMNRTVYFKGAVPMDEVIGVVASAAVSVVPTQNACLSYYFEASNKIFHSLMAGVPVAMSDHAEKRLIADTHGVGILFDETDPKAMAETIEAFVADDEALAKARANCLEAAKSLNWEHEEHRFRTAFKALLGDAVGPVPPIRLLAEDEAQP